MTYFEELVNTRIMHSENMAATISSKALDIRKESIKRSLSNYETVGHRQEYVTTIDGVMYFDDAKAETVNATWFTMENAVKPIIWIASGRDKNNDFTELLPLVKQNVKALICLDDKTEYLKKAFAQSITDIYSARNIEEAVKMASILAQEGEIVLFSPTCKSSKRSETFNERGNQFRNSVMQIENA